MSTLTMSAIDGPAKVAATIQDQHLAQKAWEDVILHFGEEAIIEWLFLSKDWLDHWKNIHKKSVDAFFRALDGQTLCKLYISLVRKRANTLPLSDEGFVTAAIEWIIDSLQTRDNIYDVFVQAAYFDGVDRYGHDDLICDLLEIDMWPETMKLVVEQLSEYQRDNPGTAVMIARDLIAIRERLELPV